MVRKPDVWPPLLLDSKVKGADNIITALEHHATMIAYVLSTSGDFQVPNWRTSLP